MQFSKQDFLTFGLGLGAALVVTLGEALVRLESEPVDDYEKWAASLLTGFLSATGRYLVTRVPELIARQPR